MIKNNKNSIRSTPPILRRGCIFVNFIQGEKDGTGDDKRGFYGRTGNHDSLFAGQQDSARLYERQHGAYENRAAPERGGERVETQASGEKF